MKSYQVKIRIVLGILVIYFVSLVVLKAGAVDSPEKRMDGIEEAGVSFAEFQVPEDVKVVGIGEATHGNREFQFIKMQMLQKLVEQGSCHAIAFEMNPGEAAVYNDAICDAESDLSALLSDTDYPLYDTEEMLALLCWMKEYNLEHPTDPLHFYGVDMQGDIKEFQYLDRFCHEYDGQFGEEELKKLEQLAALAQAEESYDGILESRDFIEGLRDKLRTRSSSMEDDAAFRFQNAAMIANTLLQWIDAPSFDEDANAYGQYRDDRMAENLKAYYEIEAERGYPQILITAHNGHTMKGNAQGYGEYTMGNKINELFDGSYYTVGTEFYHTCVNIHTAGTYDDAYLREDHEYTSEDMLAYQAQFFEGGVYCLDFAKVTDSSSRIWKWLHTPHFTGCAGEGYNAYMDMYRTYRSKLVVSDHYDAMIYFYETTPIRVRSYK